MPSSPDAASRKYSGICRKTFSRHRSPDASESSNSLYTPRLVVVVCIGDNDQLFDHSRIRVKPQNALHVCGVSEIFRSSRTVVNIGVDIW